MHNSTLGHLLSKTGVCAAAHPEKRFDEHAVLELTIPPYGYRKNWVPRCMDDFGDGGAFPEVHLAQYPLGMGMKKQDEKVLLSEQQINMNPNKKVYSTYRDLQPRQTNAERRPSEQEIKEKTLETKRALERLVCSKVQSALPVQHADKQNPAQFVRYRPSAPLTGGPQQRIIRMVTAQKDPMEPPKFKINAKIPRGPPSPPVPVLHSPTRKVTAREQQEWKIPPCISNWKNPKGYTIPLDKRLAADGRGLQSSLNEGFARLAEALYVADREAREAIETRAQLERRLAQKEKDRKEEELRRLADQARAVRSGVMDTRKSGDFDPGVAEREEIRRDRQRDRQRQRAIQRAAPEKRTKLMKERERDITESIALGVPSRTGTGVGQEFDSRLMDMSKGLDSGFGADDVYAVYDKPWREENAVANTLYRPSKNLDAEVYGDDIHKLANARQFVGAKDQVKGRVGGPVAFEKFGGQQQQKVHSDGEDDKRRKNDDDPFGLGQFFEQVKKGKH
ncbi:hypothetical protein ACOME3_008556 [Neoechinorhynchus agilis]